MKQLLQRLLPALLLLLGGAQQLYAQCAMCRATVESSSQSGGIGSGLNTGILYLMALPYIIIAFIGYFWYKNSKKQKARRQL